MTRARADEDGNSLVRMLGAAVKLGDGDAFGWLQQQGMDPVDPATVDAVLLGRLVDGVVRYLTMDRLYGVAPVVSLDDGRFRIDPSSGKWAIVQGVVDRVSAGWPLIDLIAWHPRAPDRMRLLTGEAVWLGGPPGLGSATPRLARNARAWLALPDELGATCVLNWTRRAIDELRAYPRVLVDDDDLRELVQRRMCEALPRVELAT